MHELEHQLEAKSAEWQRLRAEANFSGPDAGKRQAADFYHRELLPLVAEKARLRWLEAHDERRTFDVMVSVLGFSPATSIIACSVLRPQHLILVTSGEADHGIDIVGEAVVPRLVARRNFRHHRCNPTDPLDIYAKIKASLEEIQAGGDGGTVRAIIDITGGKKVMSAAASLMAWRLDLPLCYVESEFDRDARMPRTGSEHLIFLDNPVNIYREEEFAAALRIFDGGRFTHARESFGRLADLLSDPVPARFMATLSDYYRAWCDLDFQHLATAGEALEERLPEVRRRGNLSSEHDRRLTDQLAFTRNLVEKNPSALLLAFHLLGRHYGRGLRRWDFAALFFYRTIEGCLVQRLRDLDPGFAAKPVDYAWLGRDPEALLTRYNEIADTLGKGQRETELPARLGLINSAALLLALDDPLLPNAGYVPPGGLGHLKALTDLRNSSILAHGSRSVSEDDCRQLEAAAKRFLHRLFDLSGWTFPGRGLDDACDRLSFLTFAPDRP